MAYRCNRTSTALCPCEGKDCIFRGTVLYIQDCQVRAKRDVDMQNTSFRVPVKIRNKDNEDIVRNVITK